MGAILRKYGAGTTILFPLIKAGAQDFATNADYTPAAGDLQISKDEGAFANTGTTTPTYEGNGMWSIALTATEMQAARILLTVIDSAVKAVEDQAILIETYGNASGQHEFDLDSALTPTTIWAAATRTLTAIGTGIIDATARNEIADSLLGRNLASVAGAAARSPLNAFRFMRNRWRLSGATLTVYEEDDTTPAWTSAITSAPSDNVVESDP